MSRTHEPIPADWDVQPLTWAEIKALGPRVATDGYCGLSWDDEKVTAWTPAPSGRCPFEPFHIYSDYDDDPGMRGEEMDGYNMTPRNPDGSLDL